MDYGFYALPFLSQLQEPWWSNLLKARTWKNWPFCDAMINRKKLKPQPIENPITY
jgi:hypothetical protein